MATQFAIPADAASFYLSIGLTGVTHIQFVDDKEALIDPVIYLLSERAPRHTPKIQPGLRLFSIPSPRDISEFIVNSTVTHLKSAGLKRLPDVHFSASNA